MTKNSVLFVFFVWSFPSSHKTQISLLRSFALVVVGLTRCLFIYELFTTWFNAMTFCEFSLAGGALILLPAPHNYALPLAACSVIGILRHNYYLDNLRQHLDSMILS
jgi:hypothetical protein